MGKIDLRYYVSMNNVTYTRDEFYEKMVLSAIDSPVTSSIEILGSKVVKFLLTERGSDAFNPDYGGVSMHHVQLSEEDMPKFRLEVLDDIAKCTEYIINTSESQLAFNDTESARLASITLVDITYATLAQIDVYIDILSTIGKHQVVTITKHTDS